MIVEGESNGRDEEIGVVRKKFKMTLLPDVDTCSASFFYTFAAKLLGHIELQIQASALGLDTSVSVDRI